METKEVKIQTPKGYEIDKENSTFECIKFKPIKRYITYEDVCNSIFKAGYYTNSYGELQEVLFMLSILEQVKIMLRIQSNLKEYQH